MTHLGVICHCRATEHAPARPLPQHQPQVPPSARGQAGGGDQSPHGRRQQTLPGGVQRECLCCCPQTPQPALSWGLGVGSQGFFKGLSVGRGDSVPEYAVRVDKMLILMLIAKARGFLANSSSELLFPGFRDDAGCLGVFQSSPAHWLPPKFCLPPPSLHGFKSTNSQKKRLLTEKQE